jgi:hypothetical protein
VWFNILDPFLFNLLWHCFHDSLSSILRLDLVVVLIAWPSISSSLNLSGQIGVDFAHFRAPVHVSSIIIVMKMEEPKCPTVDPTKLYWHERIGYTPPYPLCTTSLKIFLM